MRKGIRLAREGFRLTPVNPMRTQKGRQVLVIFVARSQVSKVFGSVLSP